jgi:hypothetical protein
MDWREEKHIYCFKIAGNKNAYKKLQVLKTRSLHLKFVEMRIIWNRKKSSPGGSLENNFGQRVLFWIERRSQLPV